MQRDCAIKMATKLAKPSDICRVCIAEFHIKYGIPESKPDNRPSTENLFRPSQRKECFGVILVDVCRSVGITVVESKTYSDRICTPCARKIRINPSRAHLNLASLPDQKKIEVHRAPADFLQMFEDV